jgi:hypothetical protein
MLSLKASRMSNFLIHTTTTGIQAAKFRCLACEATNVEMSKEHFWPRWLIERTKANRTDVKWSNGKMVNPSSATIPLCKKCNNAFGTDLEAPVITIFDQLEEDRGISDYEAELLARWMWKFEGLGWLLHENIRTYSHSVSLKQRVLNRLTANRSEVSIAIARIEGIDSKFGDMPMGIDSEKCLKLFFVSGVFCKVAIVVLLTRFTGLLPSNYSVYTFAESIDSKTETARIFFIPTSDFRMTWRRSVSRV